MEVPPHGLWAERKRWSFVWSLWLVHFPHQTPGSGGCEDGNDPSSCRLKTWRQNWDLSTQSHVRHHCHHPKQRMREGPKTHRKRGLLTGLTCNDGTLLVSRSQVIGSTLPVLDSALVCREARMSDVSRGEYSSVFILRLFCGAGRASPLTRNP